MADMAAENLVAGVTGRIPPNVVNRELTSFDSAPRGSR